jgi:hypothetical protein
MHGVAPQGPGLPAGACASDGCITGRVVFGGTTPPGMRRLSAASVSGMWQLDPAL